MPYNVTLDCACAPEQLPVEHLEGAIGCVENEAAGNAYCNSNGAAIELNGKSLCLHGNILPARRSASASPLAIE